jgi:hypothetical protein
MTGKYPIHTGMQHAVLFGGEARGLPLAEKLLPCYHRPSGAVELSSPSSGPVSRFVDRCRFNAGVANAPRRRR